MNPRVLASHKIAPKRLEAMPSFKGLRRGRLPKPLHKLGGERLRASDLVSVGGSYQVCFVWRDGQLLADTAFYAWLFLGQPGKLVPLAAMHYHPSHKPVHLMTPCNDERDFTNRQLPGTTEFHICDKSLDPRLDADRVFLVDVFCIRCGISLGSGDGLLI